MISAAARIGALLALAAAAAVVSAEAVADPVEKAHLRTSPKSSQASPGVYFDPESGRFRKKPPSAASIARYSAAERNGRHRESAESGPLSSSEETQLTAVLPLVRFTRKKADKGQAESRGEAIPEESHYMIHNLRGIRPISRPLTMITSGHGKDITVSGLSLKMA